MGSENKPIIVEPEAAGTEIEHQIDSRQEYERALKIAENAFDIAAEAYKMVLESKPVIH